MLSILSESTTPFESPLYTDALTSNSLFYSLPGAVNERRFYFQAIEVTVSIPGIYTFQSNSTIDTMGYFYNSSFDPYNLTKNLIAKDDESGGQLQFRIDVPLESELTYILVVTTHFESITGTYSISAVGPAIVSLTSITPSTTSSTPKPTTPSISSSYKGTLSSDSQNFSRPGGNTERPFYYEDIQVAVSVAGTYSFQSNSTVDVMGYFYHTSFDPNNSTSNLMTKDDDGGDQLQFRIQTYLETEWNYIFVVTTHVEFVTGNFLISAVGPSIICFLKIIRQDDIGAIFFYYAEIGVVLNNTCTAILSGTVTILVNLSNVPKFLYRYHQYSFIAKSNKTTMILALRQDPSYWCLDDISVTNNGTEMWQNGGFELNSLTPQHYTYCNPDGASASGIISTNCPHSGSYSFYDGSVKYSDYLSQSFATVIGSNYNISFWLANEGGGPNSFLAIIGG
ncbi:unnamed protein product [Rotaria magnacalcarata]